MIQQAIPRVILFDFFFYESSLSRPLLVNVFPVLLWFTSRCLTKSSCSHRWGFGKWLDYGYAILDYGCVTLDWPTVLFSTVFGVMIPLLMKENPSWVVELPTSRHLALGGIKTERKEGTLLSACHVMESFFSVMPLSHAALPWNQMIMDWNFYNLWAK